MARSAVFDITLESARPGLLAGVPGALASALLPVAIFAALNGGVVALGFGMPAARFGEGLGLSATFSALAWCLALSSWGLVRWAVAARGAKGAHAADWLVVLMAGAIAFPFITLGFDFFWTSVVFFALGLLGLAALRRVIRVSALAGLAMGPSVVALVLPGLFGFAVLAMGWTPPFAAIQGAEAAPAPAASEQTS